MTVKNKTIDMRTYKTVVFAENVPSPFHHGCTEVWELWDERMPKGYGYRMFCTVYDSQGNQMFRDHGETYEIYENAKNPNKSMCSVYNPATGTWKSFGPKASEGSYPYLWKQLRKAYKALGIKDYNINMED